MRCADYAPTHTPKSFRLIRWLDLALLYSANDLANNPAKFSVSSRFRCF